MLVHRVFSIGPIITSAAPAFMVMCVDPDGSVSTKIERSRQLGLQAWVDEHGADALVASLDLQAEADALGLATRALQDDLLRLRGAMTIVMLTDMLRPGISPDTVVALADSASAFAAAAPWRWLDGDMPIRVRYGDGRVRKQLDASVLGNAGEVFGLALYLKARTLARLVKGQSRAPDDTLTLLLEREPAWAVEVMRASFDLPFVPMLIKLEHGRPSELRPHDLQLLAATMQAVAELSPTQHDVHGALQFDVDHTAEVHVEIVSPPITTRTSPTKKIPRNAPCPCGSGRKYKRCCIGNALPELQSRPPRPRKDLSAQMVDFIHEQHEAHFQRCCDELLGPSERDPALAQIIIPMALFHMPLPSGETVAARFSAAKGATLGVADRRELQARIDASMSIWEAQRVEPGRGFEALDLLTGERTFVHEVSGTADMRPYSGVMCREFEHDGKCFIDGLYPKLLGPDHTHELVAELRRMMRRKGWREDQRARVMFDLWRACLARRDQQEAERRTVTLTNTDGDILEVTHDHYDIVDGDGEGLADALHELPGVVVLADESDDFNLGFTRRGNAQHRSWVRTTIGSATIRGASLSTEANCPRRADLIRGQIEAQVGERVCHRERSVEPPQVLESNTLASSLAIDAQLISGWLRPDLDDMAYDQLRSWQWAPNPALDGLTPRAAVARAKSRQRVHALLRKMQHKAPPELWVAYQRLREDLGIDAAGDRVVVSKQDRLMGMGRKISATLLEYAMPLLLDTSDEQAGEAIVRVAAVVWNHVYGLAAEPLDDQALAQLEQVCVEWLADEQISVEPELLREWIEYLVPRRRLFEDGRLVHVISVEQAPGMFNVSAAGADPALVAGGRRRQLG